MHLRFGGVGEGGGGLKCMFIIQAVSNHNAEYDGVQDHNRYLSNPMIVVIQSKKHFRVRKKLIKRIEYKEKALKR